MVEASTAVTVGTVDQTHHIFSGFGPFFCIFSYFSLIAMGKRSTTHIYRSQSINNSWTKISLDRFCVVFQFPVLQSTLNRPFTIITLFFDDPRLLCK